MNTIVSLVSLAGILTVIISPVTSVPGHEHGHGHGHEHNHVDYYHEPKYSYGYGVNDHYTGDVKSAHETRHNGWTEGSYSVLQPDGILRTVKYVADPVHGFRATVHNQGWSQHEPSHPKGHGHGHGWSANHVSHEDEAH